MKKNYNKRQYCMSKINRCYSLKYYLKSQLMVGKSTDILETFLKAICRHITFPIRPVDNKVTRHEKDFLEKRFYSLKKDNTLFCSLLAVFLNLFSD